MHYNIYGTMQTKIFSLMLTDMHKMFYDFLKRNG